jgi:hypothetical protein
VRITSLAATDPECPWIGPERGSEDHESCCARIRVYTFVAAKMPSAVGVGIQILASKA